MLEFWDHQALTRHDMEKIGEYRGSKFATQKYKLYAPHYPPEFLIIERTLGLVDVANTEFVPWYTTCHETKKDPFWRNLYTIRQIKNSFDQLLRCSSRCSS